jgi:hypothetical protein
MNFSELDDFNYNNNNLFLSLPNYNFSDNKSSNYLDGDLILTTYNNLTSLLENYKNEIIILNKNKEDFYNYQNGLFGNHLNIINICEYDNTTTELFITYNNLIKEKYDNWICEIYNPKIKKLNEDIQATEIKIANFRKLFIHIINNFVNKDDIDNKKLCSICFENEVDMCSVPCGHTCCSRCVISSRMVRSNENNCLNCRNKIESYIKLYFLI